MPIGLVLSTLLTASAVWGRPNLGHRATPQVYEACINANDIALTFDDGPYIYLRTISDHFTAAGAKATFFMNGNNFDCIYNANRISDLQYAYAAGHMMGSHTWSHADLTTLSTVQLNDAMFRMEEAFSRILGVSPAFMRPPFGDYNSNVQSVAAARGQSLALWDWDTGDADGNTTAQSEALYNDVVNAKVQNAVILEHETEETTANTLVPFAIQLFQSKGYNLVTMAQCLGVDPYQSVGVPRQQSSSWTCDGTPDPGQACGGSIACETGTPSGGGCNQTYTVISGDTCSAIESRTGVSDAQLHALNPGIDSGCTNLQVGQTLCLPGGAGGGGDGCAQTYTVVSGDTCSAIESSTGISDAQLHALNPAINSGCTNLQVGQTLCLPEGADGGGGGGGGCAQTYTVVSGDTCFAIESKTGVSDAQLHALNPAINSGCTNLQVGQTLCLPVGAGGGDGCAKTYTVVSGDTCFTIESKTGVSDAQLHALNPGINSGCSNLQVGQTLCV
ncbi:hypothetical protein C8J57DRAFT_1147505 [Mycena rebaudengoi]|nr:hypothetical protein C8J57DRAFT_1147505 [Mycena rebaudengoi]